MCIIYFLVAFVPQIKKTFYFFFEYWVGFKQSHFSLIISSFQLPVIDTFKKVLFCQPKFATTSLLRFDAAIINGNFPELFRRDINYESNRYHNFFNML